MEIRGPEQLGEADEEEDAEGQGKGGGEWREGEMVAPRVGVGEDPGWRVNIHGASEVSQAGRRARDYGMKGMVM